MAITTFDQILGGQKQSVAILKTAPRATIGTGWFSMYELGGNPGGGTLAGSSTTTGTVPTDATAGHPLINAFGGGTTGYLAQVDFGNTVASRLRVYDLLWKGGAYAFNASTSGNTPTSYSSRVPGGTDFNNTEIWLEQVTAGTGIQNVNVTYINQAGTSGRSTGTVATATNTVGRMFPLPLQAGDTGVQGVTGVVGSVASAGTFNILVMRRLWSGRVKIANDGDTHGPDKTLMPELFADSALTLIVNADSTSSGVPDIEMTIVSG